MRTDTLISTLRHLDMDLHGHLDSCPGQRTEMADHLVSDLAGTLADTPTIQGDGADEGCRQRALLWVGIRFQCSGVV